MIQILFADGTYRVSVFVVVEVPFVVAIRVKAKSSCGAVAGLLAIT